MDKLCNECRQPLSEYLISNEADWHILCFPEDEWDKWLEKKHGTAADGKAEDVQ